MPRTTSLLTPEYQNQLSFGYRKALLKLETKITKNPKDELNLLEEFSSNYLMPAELWHRWISLIAKNYYDPIDPSLEAILKKAEYHLCHSWVTTHANKGIFKYEYHQKALETKKFLIYSQDISQLPKTLASHPRNFDKELSKLEFRLTYPHDKIRSLFIIYEKFNTKHISPKIKEAVDKMDQLYYKIQAAKFEGNDQKWFNCLCESSDYEFIKLNVENCLEADIFNKKLWKLYLGYLKTVDPQEMLQGYSKYCRFFTNDNDMKKKYEKMIQKYGPVYVEWKNLFRFESRKIKQTQPEISNTPEEESNWYYPPISNFMIFTKLQSHLSLPQPLMNYVVSKAALEVPGAMLHLQKASKRFWNSFPVAICCRLSISRFRTYTLRPIEFIDESLLIYETDLKTLLCPKLFITASLTFTYTNQSALSMFIKSHIYKCNARHIEIWNQNLTAVEFDFLVGHGQVESLKLENTNIFIAKKRKMALEDILAKMPKLRSLDITNIGLRDSQALIELQLTNKIIYFNIYGLFNSLDANYFYQFLKMNAAWSSTWNIYFWEDIGMANIKNFETAINNHLLSWLPKKSAPKIYISSLHHLF